VQGSPWLAACRRALSAPRRRLLALLLRGDEVECPCCGRSYRHFAKFKGHRRMCPGCGSLERHRGLWLFLRDEVELGSKPARLLHFAPEEALTRNLKALPTVECVTADLQGPADLHLDITKMDLPDGDFDGIICSHVLEHVADDRSAMREMLRVLRPGGWAVVMVPFLGDRDTYENPSITSAKERWRHFGQEDHVRRYGRGLAGRLRESGFEVEQLTLSRVFSPAVIARNGLLPDETAFMCERPAPR
jgi:SAM-dependent methyltransferase